ncbi:MAG TPA: hypothetical protein EYN67_10945 [Flavobacteriales bacterium]|nr:hypothetical protein [Methylococcaceae bacterium]HHZ96047.1 hypothetical protein [Flavobacteriales bacterium]
MANSKRKAKCCGERVRDYIVINNVAYCSREAAVKWSYANKEVGKAIKHKAQKKEYNANRLPPRKTATKKACHEYIRYRDKDDCCICCGEPLQAGYHAGHWLESGANPKVRYDEDNIHGQNVSCNVFKGGDSGNYKENLIAKIGIDRVNRLLELKGGAVKRTADDYREIEALYKSKLKQITAG